MEKTIVTAFMVIISVIVSVMVYNTVYPAAVQGSASLRNMRDRMDDRIQSQITIVQAVGELDRMKAGRIPMATVTLMSLSGARTSAPHSIACHQSG